MSDYRVYEDDDSLGRPLQSKDLRIASLKDVEWAKKAVLTCVDAPDGGNPKFFVQDLTGAFSGDEGPECQFYFATKKGLRHFVRNELGLDTRLPPDFKRNHSESSREEANKK